MESRKKVIFQRPVKAIFEISKEIVIDIGRLTQKYSQCFNSEKQPLHCSPKRSIEIIINIGEWMCCLQKKSFLRDL